MADASGLPGLDELRRGRSGARAAPPRTSCPSLEAFGGGSSPGRAGRGRRRWRHASRSALAVALRSRRRAARRPRSCCARPSIAAPDPAQVPDEQTPLAGTAVVSPLRAADPGGGLPWTLRVARSKTGFTCTTVGQVRDGVFGLTGLDGVFRRLPGELSDACGQGGTLTGARVVAADQLEDVRSIVYGVAGDRLRARHARHRDRRPRAALGPGGTFVAALRGYPEDQRARRRAALRGGRTERHDFGARDRHDPGPGAAARRGRSSATRWARASRARYVAPGAPRRPATRTTSPDRLPRAAHVHARLGRRRAAPAGPATRAYRASTAGTGATPRPAPSSGASRAPARRSRAVTLHGAGAPRELDDHPKQGAFAAVLPARPSTPRSSRSTSTLADGTVQHGRPGEGLDPGSRPVPEAAMIARLALVAALAGSAVGAAAVLADEPMPPAPQVPVVAAPRPRRRPARRRRSTPRNVRLLLRLDDPAGGAPWAIRALRHEAANRRPAVDVLRARPAAGRPVRLDRRQRDVRRSRPGHCERRAPASRRGSCARARRERQRFTTVDAARGRLAAAAGDDHLGRGRARRPRARAERRAGDRPRRARAVPPDRAGRGAADRSPASSTAATGTARASTGCRTCRRGGERPSPGTDYVAARAPDPAGGEPWGLIASRGERGGICLSTTGPARRRPARARRPPPRHLHHAARSSTIADCGRKRSRRAPSRCASTRCVCGAARTTRRAAIERRVARAAGSSSAGASTRTSRSVTIRTPRDVRTLVPSSPAHAILAVYDGRFPGGQGDRDRAHEGRPGGDADAAT